MANAYVAPILDAIQTILVANYNTRIDDISTSIPDWQTAMISKYRIELAIDPPWISVFPFGDSVHDSQVEIGTLFDANWQIATVIDAQGEDAGQLQTYLDIYLTALIRTLTKGSTGLEWTFNQTADIVILTRTGFEPLDEDEQGTIYGAAYAIWECITTNDPVNE